MKIYTRTGDKGQTSLIGGTRVPKYHDRIEAYGTLDELNSFLGLIRDQDIGEHYKKVLSEIQEKVFIMESALAKDPEKDIEKTLPKIYDKDIEFLEDEIDSMNSELEELQSFILPGGHTVVSYCHITRCVCRRAERLIIKLAENDPVEESILKYLNRLSDYLFVLGRKLGKDLNIDETLWKARV